MKTVFVARSGPEAQYIATELSKQKLVDLVVFETGRIAKKKKLQRMLKTTPFWMWWRLPLDLVALKWLNTRSQKVIAELAANQHATPHLESAKIIDDINDDDFLVEMKTYAPDLIVIYGTALARKPIRDAAKKGMINFHGALVPFFRNVYGDYWALARRQFSRIGTSLLWVDQGVDMGDIVTQRSFGLKEEISLSMLRKMILIEGTLDLVHVLQAYRKTGEIPRIKTLKIPNTQSCTTPTFFEVLKNRVKR